MSICHHQNELKLYIVKDYKRLKTEENSKLSLWWNLNREISKFNYRVHTDAIKENLIPPVLTPQQISYTYANEADLLNTVLFGKTAKEWRDSNPNENPNARLIPVVEKITPEIEAVAGGAGEKGTGGFTTKVKAARIANDAGIPVVVMNGSDTKKIYNVLNGESIGTRFLP